MASDFYLTVLWLRVALRHRSMAMATLYANLLGYVSSVQFRTCFIPSVLLHRLPSEEISSDEEVDLSVFHRPMDLAALLAIPDFMYPRWVGPSFGRVLCHTARATL